MAIKRLPDNARELSTYAITTLFADEDGADLAPDTATWTLTKMDGTVVNSRENVEISSPTASEKVVLQEDDLAILDGGLLEDRVFTVKATYSSGRPFNEEVLFSVQALVAVG